LDFDWDLEDLDLGLAMTGDDTRAGRRQITRMARQSGSVGDRHSLIQGEAGSPGFRGGIGTKALVRRM
jgi:hypothetical protein